VLPSDDRVADIRAQCVSPSSPAPSPIAAQAAQQSPQQKPLSPSQQQPSSDEQARQQEAFTNLNQTVESLKSALAASNARIAELEKGKATADSALTQTEQARSDAQKAQQETDQARNADKAKLDAVTAQFEAYKASAGANTDWRWAYAGIGGLIGLIAGLTTFLFTKSRRVGLRLHT
jgi:chromosome segregation ATPase